MGSNEAQSGPGFFRRLRRGVRKIVGALDFLDGVGRLLAIPFRLLARLLDALS